MVSQADRKISDQQLRLAALIHCETHGLDPDEMVWHSPAPNAQGLSIDIGIQSTRWQMFAGQIEAMDRMLTSATPV